MGQASLHRHHATFRLWLVVNEVVSMCSVKREWSIRNASSMTLCIFPNQELTMGVRGGTVGWGTALQFGRTRVDSQWCHWNFSLTQSFRSPYDPGVDSASNRNEYQEYFLGGKGGWCVRLTTLPPSCADCLEIWNPRPPGTLWACSGL
jgi:hypothetical protein